MDIASMVIDSPIEKVPRPLNCFMTYRLEKQKEILEKCPGTNHRDISKITATWWKELSAEEKEPYRIKAHNAKFEHERRYPNYKFNPKKKVTKTRAYKKRTDTAFLLQDMERKQKLYALCQEQSKTAQEATSPSPTPTATTTATTTTNTTATFTKKVEEPIKLDSTEKEDICCANCYGSSKTCFSKPHKTLNASTTTSPYSVAYYDYPTTATTTTTTTTYKSYGPTKNPTSAFPSYNLPMVNSNASNNKDYYTETKTTVSYASPSRPFHSLTHSNYNHSPPSTIMPSPPPPIHPTSFYYHQ